MLVLMKAFDFNLGYTLLLFNGLITFAGLWMIRIRRSKPLRFCPLSPALVLTDPRRVQRHLGHFRRFQGQGSVCDSPFGMHYADHIPPLELLPEWMPERRKTYGNNHNFSKAAKHN